MFHKLFLSCTCREVTNTTSQQNINIRHPQLNGTMELTHRWRLHGETETSLVWRAACFFPQWWTTNMDGLGRQGDGSRLWKWQMIIPPFAIYQFSLAKFITECDLDYNFSQYHKVYLQFQSHKHYKPITTLISNTHHPSHVFKEKKLIVDGVPNMGNWMNEGKFLRWRTPRRDQWDVVPDWSMN